MQFEHNKKFFFSAPSLSEIKDLLDEKFTIIFLVASKEVQVKV